jgi:hypothetical protein
MTPVRHRPSLYVLGAAWCAVWFGLAGRDGAPAAQSLDARTLLQQVAGFSDRDFKALEAGQPVVKILDSDRREIAVAGAVRIDAPRDGLIGRFRDVEALKKSNVVLDLGRLSATPRADDLRGLPFDEYDLDLRDCRPGECRVRLSANDIGRFHREVDWRAGDWQARSATVWRDVLAGYVSAYATDRSLPVYANKQGVRDEMALLLRQSAFLSTYAPALQAYLSDTRARPAGVDDVIYWSKEDFGIRSVIRVSHQIIVAPPPRTPQAPLIVATNQIYAAHYLDAWLGLSLALDAPGVPPASGFYLVTVNRARTRSLSGFLRGMVRSNVQGKSRDMLHRVLSTTKMALERPEGKR